MQTDHSTYSIISIRFIRWLIKVKPTVLALPASHCWLKVSICCSAQSINWDNCSPHFCRKMKRPNGILIWIWWKWFCFWKSNWSELSTSASTMMTQLEWRKRTKNRRLAMSWITNGMINGTGVSHRSTISYSCRLKIYGTHQFQKKILLSKSNDASISARAVRCSVLMSPNFAFVPLANSVN